MRVDPYSQVVICGDGGGGIGRVGCVSRVGRIRRVGGTVGPSRLWPKGIARAGRGCSILFTTVKLASLRALF